MRPIACCPIQYLTALGIASQSPGYLPKAEYMRPQMKRKTRPAVRIGTKCRRIHPPVTVSAAWTPAGRGLPRKAFIRKTQTPKATKGTPVMEAFSLVTPASAKKKAAPVNEPAIPALQE